MLVVKASDLEIEFLNQIRLEGLPTPMLEHEFARPRKYRFDFFWPYAVPPLAVEVEGGIFGKGGHSTGVGITRDCEKGNMACLKGIRLLRVLPAHIKHGEAIHLLKGALQGYVPDFMWLSPKERKALRAKARRAQRKVRH